MAPTILVVVPFPAGGHPMNAFNLAFALGSPSLEIYVVVPQLTRAESWVKSVVQPPNPHVHIRELPDRALGEKALSWDPMTVVQAVGGQEWATAIGLTLDQLRQEHPHANIGGLVVQPMMRATVDSKSKYGVKIFAISPVANFMFQMSTSTKNVPGVELDDGLEIIGLGGIDRPLQFTYADCVDVTGPMWHDFVKPGVYGCDGQILSNSNAGIEGDDPVDSGIDNFLIGPLLPEWFFKVIDEGYEQALGQRPGDRKENDSDGVLEFLDKQKDRSTVYVTLGTHADFSIDQAKLIMSVFQEHSTPFIFVNHGATADVKEALGEYTGGVITSWAPQLDVLAHPAINFTITHSGFGTLVEGVIGGAMPFVACPIASDQFMDTKFMDHVGILLGCIGINKKRSQMQRTDPYPYMPEDDGQTVRELLGNLLSTKEGALRIEKARKASLALRKRIMEARATDVPKELQRWRDSMSA